MKSRDDNSRKSDRSPAAARSPSMKAAPRAVAQAKAGPGPGGPGVVQLLLAEDLNDKKINVAIAGETHNEIPPGPEKRAWADVGVKLHYEAAEIPLQGEDAGTSVMPDPVILRLSFGLTSLKEYTESYLGAAKQPGSGAGLSGGDSAAEVLDYILPVLIGDLDHLFPAPKPKAEKEAGPAPKSEAAEEIAALKELRAILKGGKLVSVEANEMERRVLVSKVRRDLELVGAFIRKQHDASGFGNIKFDSASTMVGRSQQMLTQINAASGSLDNTIYKVGNDHVKDMQKARWVPDPKVAILDKEAYTVEYNAIAKKAAPPAPAKATPKVPGPPGASVSGTSASGVPVPGSSAEVPKKSAVPGPGPKVAAAPVGKPAPTPMASASPPTPGPPEPKLEKKSAKPQREKPKAENPKPVKSKADRQVEQLLVLMANAPEDAKGATGYLAIKKELDNIVPWTVSEDVIVEIRKIIVAANKRWGLRRSDGTKKLYKDISGIIAD